MYKNMKSSREKRRDLPCDLRNRAQTTFPYRLPLLRPTNKLMLSEVNLLIFSQAVLDAVTLHGGEMERSISSGRESLEA